MPGLRHITIQGYRPFREFGAPLGSLEVMVGANGSGKSSLFEFLKFIRDGVYQEIPPEIIAGSIGQQIFHTPGPERFDWKLQVDMGEPVPIVYEGQLMGPVGRTNIAFERVRTERPLGLQHNKPYVFMDLSAQRGVIQDSGGKLKRQELQLQRPNQLGLSTITNPALVTLYNLREYILRWRFYSSFNIANQKLRAPVLTEQEPVLHENGENMSAVLFYLSTEYPERFQELLRAMRAMVTTFKGLTIKARGSPGQVMAFWQEDGIDSELSLADLSDGILRLLCWATLCVHPKPPTLICIDEPDQGVHPRTLPILAGLLEKASHRTQILMATHSSYFLTQFSLEQLAIFRKEAGEARFYKPVHSETLRALLDEFGSDEIEVLHRSDEMEQFA
jgi:predicted ATPase